MQLLERPSATGGWLSGAPPRYVRRTRCAWSYYLEHNAGGPKMGSMSQEYKLGGPGCNRRQRLCEIDCCESTIAGKSNFLHTFFNCDDRYLTSTMAKLISQIGIGTAA